MRKNTMIKAITLMLIVVMMFTQIPIITASAKDSSNRRIMVSMGDSYSSGEGVEPFYKQDLSNEVKATNPDFLAHRSEKSWPGKLEIRGVNGAMKDHKNINWFFVASSGAETVHFKGRKAYFEDGTAHKGKQKKTYDKNGVKKTTYLSPQLDIFEQFKSNEVDFVTMTIGGNDVGFSKIIESAVLEGNRYLQPSALAVKLNFAWHDFYKKGGAKENIKQAYLDVRNAAGEKAHIIVAGYPKLISTIHLLQPYFTVAEALLINHSVSKFNDEIESIITDLNTSGRDKRIRFVSVEEAFSGHEAYSTDSFINGIDFNNSQDINNDLVSAYSMHPNKEGTKVYAKCVQKEINKIDKDYQPSYSTLEDKLMSDTWVNIRPNMQESYTFSGAGKASVNRTYINSTLDDEKLDLEYSAESSENSNEDYISLSSSEYADGYEEIGLDYGSIYNTKSNNMLRYGAANNGVYILYRASIKPFKTTSIPDSFSKLKKKSATSKLFDQPLKIESKGGKYNIKIGSATYYGKPISKEIMFFSGNNHRDMEMQKGDSNIDFWLEDLGNNKFYLLVFTYEISDYSETRLRDPMRVNCSEETITFH